MKVPTTSISSRPSIHTCTWEGSKTTMISWVWLMVQPVEPSVAPRASSSTAPRWPQNSPRVGTPLTRDKATPAGAYSLQAVWLPRFQSSSRKSAVGFEESPGAMPRTRPTKSSSLPNDVMSKVAGVRSVSRGRRSTPASALRVSVAPKPSEAIDQEFGEPQPSASPSLKSTSSAQSKPFSTWQVSEQPSPAAALPSSHCSSPTISVSPQTPSHWLGSPLQAHRASTSQDELQPSPSSPSPSSQSSNAAVTTPSPHTVEQALSAAPTGLNTDALCE